MGTDGLIPAPSSRAKRPSDSPPKQSARDGVGQGHPLHRAPMADGPLAPQFQSETNRDCLTLDCPASLTHNKSVQFVWLFFWFVSLAEIPALLCPFSPSITQHYHFSSGIVPCDRDRPNSSVQPTSVYCSDWIGIYLRGERSSDDYGDTYPGRARQKRTTARGGNTPTGVDDSSRRSLCPSLKELAAARTAVPRTSTGVTIP